MRSSLRSQAFVLFSFGICSGLSFFNSIPFRKIWFSHVQTSEIFLWLIQTTSQKKTWKHFIFLNWRRNCGIIQLCLIEYNLPKKSFVEYSVIVFYTSLSIGRWNCSSGNEGVGLFPMNPISRKTFPNLKKGKELL